MSRNAVFSLLILTFILAGCATYNGVGSDAWYNQRVSELDQARTSGRMTEAEYQNARNQLDAIRVQYLNRGYYYEPRTSVGLGFGYHVWH